MSFEARKDGKKESNPGASATGSGLDSPQAAVRAAIVQEHRERNRETK